MDGKMFTIKSIEGNSYIGVPVFSLAGKINNKNYLTMSTSKKENPKKMVDLPLIDHDNVKYKLNPVETIGAAIATTQANAASSREMLSQSVVITGGSAMTESQMRSNSMAMNRRKDRSQEDINQRVDFERRSFVSTIMNELNKRVEANH